MQTTVHNGRCGRRALLKAGLGGVLGAGLAGGCGLLDRGPDTPPPPDPLEPLRAQSQALADRYSATMTTTPSLVPRLRPLRDAHLAHVAALTKIIGKPPPSGSPGTSPGSSAPPQVEADALAVLRTAEEAAARDATAACLATSAARAGVVGGIAACRTTHLEVLR